ncbi:MAG: dTDP-4-dehydrorhamnose 3,5-epimerase [Burkholderiales bacterium]|jgi:dTDP-4-dehydrorhamnose 3,5-epimerase|nr:dTDP-4-dehydrorhamnose 3,5-epimerase [Burkholderiales bacterium]
MKVTPTRLPEVLVLEPRVFRDARGFFMESWNAAVFAQAAGREFAFVQDNHSHSVQGVLRGIHYQVVRPQGKLVRVVQGAVFDVAVDLRRSSPRFGQWVSVELSASNAQQLWIPPGFGHGFLVLSAAADFLYKTTDYWVQQHDRSLRWDDPSVRIDWPLAGIAPLLSDKDLRAPLLAQAEVFE